MNKEYKIKLDLNKKLYNKKMTFNQFDENVNDFYIEVTKNNEVVKDLNKSIVTLVAIKPDNTVEAQFVEVENGLVYADLKPSMCDIVGNYQAKAMIVLEGEIVTTDTINYSVNEDKIISRLNEDVASDERFTLFTDALARLSDIEASEEQRIVNEAERILSEENRKIEEAKRVEAELVRQHEEADRTKYDATRESNENIRKQNESIRLANETNRIDEEAKRVEEENKRKLAEEERNSNYNFMTEDEERRRSEANAHKEAETLRVQAEANRVNEEAKRRTTEQARVSAENTRVNNENTRETNEVVRKNNETKRVEAETQRQNRYNSFILDAEANANNFENYTNNAKVKEEERKSNELDRKSQEDRRVSNEVERISNENTRKANEVVREKNETSRQDVFENKVDEVDKKIVELNTTKDNFISSVNTKVDNKISEIDKSKSDMTTTVSNKIQEVETRFNTLTSAQQQSSEVIDARDGETSLKARLDRDIEKANKELDKIKKLEESTVSTVETESDFTTVEATSNGYFEDVKLEGKTLVNLARLDNLYVNHAEISDSVITLTQKDVDQNIAFRSSNIPFDSNNKTYTIFVNVLSNTCDGASSGIISLNPSGLGKGDYALDYTGTIIQSKATGLFTIKATSRSVTSGILFHVCLRKSSTDTPIGNVKFQVIILEGDHTQNPPSYFEGLKSVGEDVDEIVVSSVKGDGNLLMPLYTGATTSGYDKNNITFSSDYSMSYVANTWGQGVSVDVINVVKGETYVILCDTNTNMCIKGTNALNTTSDIQIPSNKAEIVATATGIGTIEFKNATETGNISCTNLRVIKKGSKEEFSVLNQDKKRLLYYNEETQAWEKPILREWDSIEKHANGKYYYHQRSGEVVLNGSENWNNDTNSSTISPATYRQSIQFNTINMPNSAFNPQTSPNIISNSLPTTTFGDVYNYNHVGISISGTDSIGTHIIINNNFIDVTELKQWLQANNLTLVYQLAQEKVYECTNIDLITYANETNYIVESGAIVPKTTLKVHSNISNVVSLLQKKVSLLESNVKASQEVQDMMILETDMRMLDIELALMDFMPMTLNLGGSNMLRSATYFNFLKNHIINKTYEKEYLENVMNKYLATGRINQDEYNELYKMLYPPVYDIELPIEY